MTRGTYVRCVSTSSRRTRSNREGIVVLAVPMRIAMDLAAVTRAECMVANATVLDKSTALRLVAQTALNSPCLRSASEAELVEQLTRRESLGSTGFGRGVAIPHCQLEAALDFVVGIITVPAGVAFDALDGQPVKVIAYLVGPANRPKKHLRLLAAISQTLQNPAVVAAMLAQTTPEALRESFVGPRMARGRDDRLGTHSLVHVFVLDDALFTDLLSVLAANELGSLVIDARGAEAYLSYVPLFAAFSENRRSEHGQVVLAVIAKDLLDQTLQSIESVTGPLAECSRVMVVVQDIAHVAGSLAAEA